MEIQPGQVYSLSANDAVMCAVLAVTNLGLKPKTAAEHPPVVVYVNDKGAIRSLVAGLFTQKWEFTGDTVAAIESFAPADAFLAWIDGDDGFKDDSEEADAADDESGDDEVEEVDAVDVSSLDDFKGDPVTHEVSIHSSATADDGPTLVCGPHPMADRLEAAFLSYSVRPMLSGDGGTGFPMHCLEFLVSPSLSMDDISQAFDPAGQNIIDVFTVGDIKVDWDGYSGVYPTIQAGIGTIATVWLTSAADEAAGTSAGPAATIDHPHPTDAASAEQNTATAPVAAPAAEVEFVGNGAVKFS